MRSYNGHNFTILNKSRQEPNPTPAATADNARLKDVIKLIRPLTKQGVASISQKDAATLYAVFSMMPRQLRKRALKKAGLKLLRPEE